ncbi:hypothetical protein A7982_13447 [Minicystis rosea]|nr:hypothetical protein A7982_13447 [Minicystis rosea]
MRISIRGLSLETSRGDVLHEAELEALWRFRLEFMRLKPEVDPAVDRAAFDAVVRACRSVGVYRDEEGIQGFTVLSDQPTEVLGTRVVLVRSTYGFMRARHRSSPLLPLMYAEAFARVGLAFPRHRMVVTEVWYPLSYLVLAFNEGVWSLGTPGISSWQRAVLHHAIETFWSDRFDATTGVVRMNTLPPPLVPARGGRFRAEAQRTLDAYVAENPQWAEGFALPAAVELGAGTALVVARTVARRAVRSMRRGVDEPRIANATE